MKAVKLTDDKVYQVRLAKPVDFGHRRLLPRDDHTLSGAALAAIVEVNGWEAVDDCKPATP